jgi:hypothetical protein
MPSLPRPDDDPRPDPPERPDNDACCHSGCDPCIFDLYDAAMERWRAELAAWERRTAAARRPQKRAAREAGDKTESAAKSGDAPAVKRAVKRAIKAAPNRGRKPKA